MSPTQSFESETPIRLLIVEDHHIVRQGLISLLQSVSGMNVVAEAPDGRVGAELYRQHLPDVVLMDLRMPVASGVETIQELRHEFPGAKVIVLTTFDGDEDVYRAMQAGARGYLLKGMEAEEFFDAGADVDPGVGVADDGIAAIKCGGVGAADGGDGVQDGVADIGAAHIAGQHGIAAAEGVPRADSVNEVADGLASVDGAGPVAVARVVGELDGVDGPDLGAETLEGEDGAGVADMAVGHPGLDGENVHAASVSVSSRVIHVSKRGHAALIAPRPMRWATSTPATGFW